MHAKNSGHQSPTKPVSHATVALSLRDQGSAARVPFARLTRAAPPPLDHAELLGVIMGANAVARAAHLVLKSPNANANARLDELHVLAMACTAEYQRRAGCVDSIDGMEGRRKANPAWALLAAIGSSVENAPEHPAITAAGVELLLSLHQQKPMAAAFCDSARVALKVEHLDGVSIKALMDINEGEKVPSWVKRTRVTFAEFLATFDDAPPPPTPPRSFEERARTELSCRAAFASHRRRAGVLDDTCFSPRQIAQAVSYTGSGIFRSTAERRAAMWITGISGLFATSTQFIPFSGATVDDWVICYDLQTGVLRRDLCCLAPDAARARQGVGAPASFVAHTPAPRDVAIELVRLARKVPGSREMGDIIPALRKLTPLDLVYPDHATLAPSFARWSRTLAPAGLQAGIGALETGITTGDVGVTARSKLHYVRVHGEEQWKSAAALYRAVGWRRPVPMPDALLAFGAAVVPSTHTLALMDKALCYWVEEMRPPKRIAIEARLLEFHNRYVRTLASRICVWLSLRSAAEISLRASIDEDDDLCIELLEKASAGRVGTLPAVMCDDLRAALENYRLHCAAFLERLRTFGWSGAAVEWLKSVQHHDDVPLLCTVHGERRITPLSTDSLLKTLPGASDLAADWGRKYMENALRLAGAQSRDIDRQQRHEVLGQEQDCATADGNEVAWVRRLKPQLDAVSRQLFKARLLGLRKGGQVK